jgi:hypothetical protein
MVVSFIMSSQTVLFKTNVYALVCWMSSTIIINSVVVRVGLHWLCLPRSDLRIEPYLPHYDSQHYKCYDGPSTLLDNREHPKHHFEHPTVPAIVAVAMLPPIAIPICSIMPRFEAFWHVSSVIYQQLGWQCRTLSTRQPINKPQRHQAMQVP